MISHETARMEEQAACLADFMEDLVCRIRVLDQDALNSYGDAGITLQELQAMVFLGRKGPVPMGEIAGHLFVGSSTITALVDRLAARDLVIRTRSQEDRRIVRVNLTDKGQSLCDHYRTIRQQHCRDILEVLNGEERSHYVEFMGRIAERMGKSDRF
ncbi:MarR family transcriptional regulator [Desulfobotulus sp. H1]|uniref:MarR family transcriptional regulator n=1 Tax=Desulfobotulus pelophilus TaxID=2823377 RepID=A0ABT3N8S6_9BACT|nr:MarR family transcriptional regulator [Desulfobotulus pelophilus]MCW7753858.1 MarR family transcriptional regulator [Desulfobotulus pelophilus]